MSLLFLTPPQFLNSPKRTSHFNFIFPGLFICPDKLNILVPVEPSTPNLLYSFPVFFTIQGTDDIVSTLFHVGSCKTFTAGDRTVVLVLVPLLPQVNLAEQFLHHIYKLAPIERRYLN